MGYTNGAHTLIIIEKHEPNTRKGGAAYAVLYMELILISDSRLKIMLTAEDMRLHGITCDTLDKSSITSRKAFWNILDEAKLQTGFDPAGSKLFVQMYPSKTGGCELFVTRLGSKDPADKDKRKPNDLLAQSVLSPPRNPFYTDAEQCIYAFDEMNDLLLGCRHLSALDDPPLARAYADEQQRRFYLVLGADAPILAEYNGTRCRPRDFAYIEEHCRLFCADAIPLLSPFAP